MAAQLASMLFSGRPEHLIPDFRRHLEQTGEPETWHYHCHEKPPRGEIEVLVRDFVIPERFITKVGLAKCPICSPNDPKYGKGHLLWSPASGKLYAVGHCCGFKYFNSGVLDEGLRQEKARRVRRGHEEFLEANWQKVAEFASFAELLAPNAREHDRVVRLLLASLTQKRANEIYRAAADGGFLTITRRNEGVEGAAGSLQGVRETFGDRPLAGFQILHRPRSALSAEARLINPTTVFRFISWPTQDHALEWLCVQPDADLRRLADRLNDAARWSNEVCAEMRALAEFLQPSNLELLNSWSRAQYALQAEVGIFRPSTTTLKVWRGGTSTKPILLHSGLDKPIPSPPSLLGPLSGN